MAKKEESLAVRTPAYLTRANDLREVFKAMAENMEGEKLSRFDFPRVTVPTGGGDFMAIPGPDGTEPARELRGVIVYTHMSRSYWKATANSDEAGNGPPDCSANDARYGQGDPGGNCEECPMAAFKSGKGGRGQACKLMRTIYLLVGNAMMPLIIQVPPTSLKAIKKYLWDISVQGRRYFQEEVLIGVQGGQKNSAGQLFSTFTFTKSRDLEEDELTRVQNYAFDIREALGIESPPLATSEA